MAEFSTLHAAVATSTNVSNLMPVMEDDLGLTPSGLSSILSAARSSNFHTKPPQSNDKVNKKTLERLQQPYHSSHVNPFLRLYMHNTERIDEDALRACLSLCVNNEPDWVHGCQLLALKYLQRELEGKSSSVSAVGNISDTPVLLPQLRGSLAQSTTPVSSPPNVSPSTAHFRFVVDTTMDESKDRYFSAQVKIKCESKGPVSIALRERLTLVDGMRSPEATDFQCLLDKSVFKKGESCMLLLSLIAKPYAVFNTIQEMIVVAFDDLVRVVVTFVIINPSAPLFGVGLPCCLTQQVQQSPLGTYTAPLFLQLLKHQFVRQQGLCCKDVVHLLCGFSHMYSPQNRDVMRQACRVQSLLDETNVGELLRDFWTASQGSASNDGVIATGSGGTSVGSASILARVTNELRGSSTSTGSALSHRPVPPSLAQPSGYAPGAVVPSAGSSQVSLTYFPNIQTATPEALLTASPAVLFALMLMWLAEFPSVIIDDSIASCDPMQYLETLLPWQQGILKWIIDMCCGMLMHKDDTDVNSRSLALTFAQVLLRGEDEPWSSEITEATNEEERLTSMDDVWKRRMSVRLHAVTAMVHWISLFESSYTKQAAK